MKHQLLNVTNILGRYEMLQEFPMIYTGLKFVFSFRGSGGEPLKCD